jgi:hypothetical protein
MEKRKKKTLFKFQMPFSMEFELFASPEEDICLHLTQNQGILVNSNPKS